MYLTMGHVLWCVFGQDVTFRDVRKNVCFAMEIVDYLTTVLSLVCVWVGWEISGCSFLYSFFASPLYN